MSNEIRTSYTTGSFLYAQVRRASDLKRYYSATTSFEDYNAAHWTSYAITLTETGSTGEYAGSMPTAITALGVYDIIIFKRLGGSAATTDTKITGASIGWDGSQEISILQVYSSLADGSITIATSNPIADDGSITIIRGDDYYNADGRALEWSTTNATTWPTLTGATITFTANKSASNDNIGGDTITATGSVVVDTGANKQVRVELPSADTATLAIGVHGFCYDVQATLTNDHIVTLATGTMTVRKDQTIVED